MAALEATITSASPQWFVQNPHDHPLFLVYSGEGCWDLVNRLVQVFGGNDSFDVGCPSLHTAMSSAMPIHFQHRNEDYFIYAKMTKEGDDGLQKQAFIGFNHLFHDISSASALVGGRSHLSRQCCQSETCTKRVQRPQEICTVFKPRKITKLSFSQEELISKCRDLSCTTNEFLFHQSACYIQRSLKRPFEFMCLHSMRKTLAVSRDDPGDYSCFTHPLHLSASAGIPRVDLVKEYFATLRNGEAVLCVDNPSLLGDVDNFWIFDTWVGSFIGRLPSESNTVLDMDCLMNMLSVFIDKLVITVDFANSVDMYIFSDEVTAGNDCDGVFTA
jgi:hypothetical protein